MASVTPRLRQIFVGFIVSNRHNNHICSRHVHTQLVEVGKFEAPKELGIAYDSGQLFLHKIFAYRGVVLFPTVDEPNTHLNKEIKGKTNLYYQVLMDSRDWPHIKPIEHSLVDEFFTRTQGNASEKLQQWQGKNHPLLQLSDVVKETTENIRVTVIPFYIGSKQTQQTFQYWWRYCIRLENIGEETVQLRERHWRIFSTNGTLDTVRARGVVGQEPVLSKELPAFQYSSHISLQSPSGHMGTFKMERKDGTSFDCRIPPFLLESKVEENSPHGFVGN
ncbi:hypothetical protein KUTeg_009376 [Tegillarca granosa]|uniref:ApaG domain-containing protein n=1 Tax=Tegillarca granosa TaxID=220873 RepID=A0ABQ9F3P0_TEGGR|nr:hypothetical protein KUTeg_009376 [Tegillarca granosa]